MLLISGCLGRTKVHAYRVSGTVPLPSKDELGAELSAAVPKPDAAWALMCDTVISYWSRGEEIPYLLSDRLRLLKYYRHREVVVDGVSSTQASGLNLCEEVAKKRGVLSPSAKRKMEVEQAAGADTGSAGAGETPDGVDSGDGQAAVAASEPQVAPQSGSEVGEELPTTEVPFGSFEWKDIDENQVEVSATIGVWSPADGVETDKSAPASGRYRFTLRRKVKDGHTYFDLDSGHALDAKSVELGAQAFQKWLVQCGSDCADAEHREFDHKETLPGTVDFEVQRREGFSDFVIRSDFASTRSILKDPEFGLSRPWEKGFILALGFEYLVGLSDPTPDGTTRFEELGRLGLELGVGVGIWRARRFNSGIETTEAGRLGLDLRISGGISEGPLSNFEANSRITLDAYLGSRLPGLTASIGVLRTQGETQRLIAGGVKIADPALGIAGTTLAMFAIVTRFAILGIDRSGIFDQ